MTKNENGSAGAQDTVDAVFQAKKIKTGKRMVIISGDRPDKLKSLF